MEDRKEEEMMDEKELAPEDVIPEERDGAQAGEEGCEVSEAGGAEAAEEEELNKESEKPTVRNRRRRSLSSKRRKIKRMSRSRS